MLVKIDGDEGAEREGTNQSAGRAGDQFVSQFALTALKNGSDNGWPLESSKRVCGEGKGRRPKGKQN